VVATDRTRHPNMSNRPRQHKRNPNVTELHIGAPTSPILTIEMCEKISSREMRDTRYAAGKGIIYYLKIIFVSQAQVIPLL
jgi:hypothetical protein